MKRIFTPGIKRIVPLLVFICAQVKGWATDTTTASTIDKSTNIFSQPWIWIAAIVVLTVTLIGPKKDSAGQIEVIRRKRIKKGITRE